MKYILFLLLFTTAVYGQTYRKSESTAIQPNLVSLQGGTLVRYGWKHFTRDKETIWQCTEIYVPRWIDADSLKKTMNKRIKSAILVDGLTHLYRTKVTVDSTNIHVKNILKSIQSEIGTLSAAQKRKVKRELVRYLAKEKTKTISAVNIVSKVMR